MKDAVREKIPAYIPSWYRTFLRVRKVYRQSDVRRQERRAARRGADRLLADGARDPRAADGAENPAGAINKCWRWHADDARDPEMARILAQLQALKARLDHRQLRFVNPAGNFLPRLYEAEARRGKLWEDAWLLRHAQVTPGQRVLDVGGASTIFSFFLASLGCDVTVVDNDWANCGTIYNARVVARRMGWCLQAHDLDACRPLPFPDASFDRVFSVCVLEHLPPAGRQALLREAGRLVKPGGIVGLTFDYDDTRPVLVTDRGLRYAYREKLERDVIRPSGLAVLGNRDWVDACPPDFFLGALFLHKPAA